MRRCCTISLLLLLVISGCRQANPDVEMLESELRWLEDQVYLLDQQLQLKSAELDSARRSNTSLKNLLAAQQAPGDTRRRSGGAGGGLGGAFGGTFGGSDRGQPLTPAPPGAGETPNEFRPPGANSSTDEAAPRTPPSRTPRPPRSDRPSTDADQEDESDDLKPPSVDLGEGAGADPVNTPEAGDSSQYRPTATLGSPMLLAAAERPASRSGVRLVLNPRVTGGCDLDDCPGDDGLMVLVQTVDASGQPLKVLGPVTLELRDPTRDANSPPLGHWDIDASVVATRYGKTLFGEGVHLQLPWSDTPPPSGTWQLTATLLTEDGEWISDQRKIPIEIAGDFTAQPASTHPSSAHPASTADRDPREPWGPKRPPTLYGAAGVPQEPSLLPTPVDEQSPPPVVAVPASSDVSEPADSLLAALEPADTSATTAAPAGRSRLRRLRR